MRMTSQSRSFPWLTGGVVPANGPSRTAGAADGPLGLLDRDWCTMAVEMAAKVYLTIDG